MVGFSGDSFRKIFRGDIKAEIKALKKGTKTANETDIGRMKEALDAIANQTETAKIYDGKIYIPLSNLKKRDQKLYMQYAKILTKKAGAQASDPKMSGSLKQIADNEMFKPIAKKIRQQLAMTQTLAPVTEQQQAKAEEIKKMQAEMRDQKEKYSKQKATRNKIALGVGGVGVAGTAVALAVALPVGIALGVVLLFGGFFTRLKLQQVRMNEQAELNDRAKDIEYQTRIYEYSKTEAFQKFLSENPNLNRNDPKILDVAYLSSVQLSEAGQKELNRLKAEITTEA